MSMREVTRLACAAGNMPQFGDVSPSKAAVEELSWFFNEAATAVEQGSHYAALLSGQAPTSMGAVERRAEAIHAAGRIKSWLDEVRVIDVRILEALYTERSWPKAVEEALGILAGPVEALPLVRAEHRAAVALRQTSAATVTEWLAERVTAGGTDAVALWRPEAEIVCAIAVRGYEHARGGRGSVVLGSAWEEEEG